MRKLFFGALVLLIPSVAFGATFTHTLSYGMSGTEAAWLQQMLADDALYAGPITGTFGPLTQSAVVSFQKEQGIYPQTGTFGPLTRTRANALVASHTEWQTQLSNGSSYTNVSGSSVHSPAYSSGGVPAGASAECRDRTYSFSMHHSGTCSHHGGVLLWLQ